MAFSMHSHSGQFCPGHAKDTLEEVVLKAISVDMQLFALTEHMPRDQEKDRYPEEIEAGDSVALLRPRHEAYIKEAIRLRDKYEDTIQLLIGFECEWIRPSYANIVTELMANPAVDFFIGSVHHVHEIPIDFDRTMYEKAREVAGGEEKLFEDYFDAQAEMLLALNPRVVGHFDLIRLLSDEPNRDLKSMPGVWARVRRNLALIKEQRGLLEINSSALRKGLKEPYPGRAVCEEFLSIGGLFTLSDDSHGIAQVGTNFEKALEYLESLQVPHLCFFERNGGIAQTQDSRLGIAMAPLADVKAGNFRYAQRVALVTSP